MRETLYIIALHLLTVLIMENTKHKQNAEMIMEKTENYKGGKKSIARLYSDGFLWISTQANDYEEPAGFDRIAKYSKKSMNRIIFLANSIEAADPSEYSEGPFFTGSITWRFLRNNTWIEIKTNANDDNKLPGAIKEINSILVKKSIPF